MFGKKNRKYTGFDGNAKGRRQGTSKLIQWIMFLNAGKFRNLGSWNVRDMRGKEGKPSVHGTGRAFDIGFKNYEDACGLMDFLVRHNEALGIEYIADYYPGPFGRGWRCDRNDWSIYKKKTMAGAPGGKWIHVEISPEVADDAGYFDAVFECLLSPAKGQLPY
jgi:hypothetical protein